jgi:predicted phage terminase large subunit-like protein
MHHPHWLGEPSMGETDDVDRRSLLALKREQWRRQCRQSFLSFAVEALASQGLAPAAHHRLIIEELSKVASGETPRLILIAPRGAAKTTYVSHLLPAWFFAARANTSIIAVSHTEQPAEVNSRTVQRLVHEHAEVLGYRLVNDAAGRWETSHGCSYTAAGVGQAVRGRRADLILVDDPLRSRAEAESETSRNSLWEFFHADLLPCLKPRGSVVLIATAYHELDLMCRLEREQPDIWKVVRLPAISEGLGDPLGRAEGVPLWLDDATFGYGQRLLVMQDEYLRHGRLRDWYAQMQGRPRPPEGAMFTPATMPLIEPAMVPNIVEHVRAWDLASSLHGDYTVGVLLGRAYDATWANRYIVLDVIRFRGPPEKVRATVKAVAESDPPLTKVWLPRDPAQAGADQADSYIRMLSGYRVGTERMSGDKATRADACASQLNIGRVGMVRAAWNAAFIEELASFPGGVFDDQVDALALAFNKIEQSGLDVWLRL